MSKCKILSAAVAVIFTFQCGKAAPDSVRPGIDWGIGIYPAHGFTNADRTEWDSAFKTGAQAGKISHSEVTHGEISLDDMFMLLDIRVPLARKYKMENFIQINIFGKIPDPLKYRREAVEIAGRYEPEYLCLGQEINYVYDNASKEEYAQFVKDLLVTYDEVRKVSPGTQVFPSFAYEPMRAKHQEFLFDDFRDSAPYFTMTSYPMSFMGMYEGYLYAEPKDIPPNYWFASDITDKDIFITETGWSTNTRWGGSRKGQAEFVSKVHELVKANPKIKKAVWITLTDVIDEDTTNTYGYPGTMGFFTIDGKDKGNWKLISE